MSRVGWGSYERYLAWRGRRSDEKAPDGLPIPPPRLRVVVVRTPHAGFFLRSGAMEAAAISTLLKNAGSPIEDMRMILDFGCGCGRVARHWAQLKDLEVAGCDYNAELVDWCQGNLPFMDARVNQLRPPLPFSHRFDLIYSLSVFTHLAEPQQHAWIQECRRALRPGGILLFTTIGSRYASSLDAEERQAFDRGELVTRFTEVEGSNLCTSYHPDAFIDRMLDGFQRIESITDGVPGVTTESPLRHQDVHLARSVPTS